ncbi:MAG: hypothetical protein RLY78_3162 [Pseudomonadota bacterium]|jgi:aspartokinase-like uncharacterized kinase|uniref:Aspartate kinase n=1 Tax=Pseudaquabacterium rugosum TaxID=2984194 RepID=A0ABU9B7R6_9BURK
MWVIKIGGSLNEDACLPQWLQLAAELGGGRVALVCGGGRFADGVRDSQRHWQFDDLAAHNMAVLAMAQSAYLAQALAPELELADSEPAIRQVLRRGRTAVWLPMAMCRATPDADTHWDVTSDSLALGLARRLNAERLVLVKSCATPPADALPCLDTLSAQGVLDRAFAQRAADAPFPIELLHKAEPQRLRERLLGLSC